MSDIGLPGSAMPPVLDPCCGSRMFYFDKDDPEVLFCDNRSVSETLCDGRALEIDPDMIADVTDLPFGDGSFNLVVFDPPHLDIGDGWQVSKYGKLPADWRGWMTSAFSECWRVLAPGGTLVFKWYEYRIALSEVLACAPVRPLLGNRRPKGSKTHWLVFFKGGSAAGGCSMQAGSTASALLGDMREWRCSACGAYSYTKVLGGEGGAPSYCPECGSKVADAVWHHGTGNGGRIEGGGAR